MKKITSFIITAIFLTISAFSQKPAIELTFTAMYYGQNVPLDSIVIENLTQGGDTTLFAPDTLLVLDYVTRMKNNEAISDNTIILSQNYPNPFTNHTKIKIFLPEKEQFYITVSDIFGRKLGEYDNVLNRGNHSFTFFPGNETNYLFTVTGHHSRQTIKLMNVNGNPLSGKKCNLVYNGNKEIPSGFKSEKAVNNFVYNQGDKLRYIGYAKNFSSIRGSDVIEDTPQTNENYEFEIIEGFPCSEIPAITYEGRFYKTVLVNNVCWLKENLNIGIMVTADNMQTDNGIVEKYCYDDNPATCGTYGGLYQWHELMQYTITPGVKGICPPGWHIPTNDEMDAMINYFGGGSFAGGPLKETGTTHWNPPNGGATNVSGFTGMPGGIWSPGRKGEFFGLGEYGYFWTSYGPEKSNALFWNLNYLYPNVSVDGGTKYMAMSARCIKE